MSELIAWLLDQLDEDERVARGASPDCTPDDPRASSEDILHITRWSPARVLVDVEAKRRIITMIHDRKTWRSEPPGQFIDLDLESRVLEHLAQAYAGRPGWREEWAA